MEKILAKTNLVEWERVEKNMPSPETILAAAGEVPDAPRYLCASDYGEAIESLRRKGYTWKEVVLWLAANDVSFSIQAVISGWRTWAKRNSTSP